jgi:hypothetical protein
MSKLKLQATDGSAGTVSLKAPASTTGNAEFELTLPGNAGSNGQLLSTNGSGVLSWSDDNSGVSLSGSTNNTIATVSGANALVGEANLTFNGTKLSIDSDNSFGSIALSRDGGVSGRRPFGIGISGSDDDHLRIAASNDTNIANAFTNQIIDIAAEGKVGISTTSPTTNLNVQGGFHVSGTSDQTKTQDGLLFQRNTSSGNCQIIAGRAGGNYTGLETYVAGASGVTKRYENIYNGIHQWYREDGTTGVLKCETGGDVKVNDGNLVIGTSGHGIDFSATSHSAGMTSELLDFYEEGTWTPVMQYHNGSAWTDVVFSNTPDQSTGIYTRIGDIVNFSWYSGGWVATAYNGSARIKGLPFDATTDNNGYTAIVFTHANCFTTDINTGFVGRSGNEIYPIKTDSIQNAVWENSEYLMVSGTYKCQ